MEGVLTHTCTLTCTDMEADDGLTAVIHQASERELAEEREESWWNGKEKCIGIG